MSFGRRLDRLCHPGTIALPAPEARDSPAPPRPDLLTPKILAAREDFSEGGRSASEASEGRGGTERPLAAEGRAEERSEMLRALRERIAAIAGRQTAPTPPRVEPRIKELPFVRSETREGPIYERLHRLPSSHHVGRIPVDAARTAESDVLALLALEPALARADLSGALFIDTETTGLGGGTGTIAFLVGLGFFDDSGRFVVEQLLLRTPSEEAPMLRRVIERVESSTLLVSFNGKAFDLPMLAARYVMNRMRPPPKRPHLDLLHVARRLHRARIGCCALKAIESSVLGFDRDTDIDGVEVAPRYLHFLRTGDERSLVAVVDHNHWDVVSMAALVALYGEPPSSSAAPADTPGAMLHAHDLVGFARTLKRARAFDRAHAVASAAIDRGVGPSALRIRGEIAKARGDRARALSDFEALSAEVDDPTVRLELAKLYEHFVREPSRALEMVEHGTGEPEAAAFKRRARLERKLERRR